MLYSAEDIGTICLFVGPERTLSGLFLLSLAFHPQCHAVNTQGGASVPDIFDDNRGYYKDHIPDNLAWMLDYSNDKFSYFMENILTNSLKPEGINAWQVRYCHAYKVSPDADELFKTRFGEEPYKNNIKSVVIRDYRYHSFINDAGVNLGDLLLKNDKLRFIMMLRDIVDIVVTLTGRDRGYKDTAGEGNVMEDLTESIIFRICQVLNWGEAFPGKIFYLTEFNFLDRLEDLSSFLEVDYSEEWAEDVKKIWKVRDKNYEHKPGDVKAIRLYLEKHLDERVLNKIKSMKISKSQIW